MRVRERGIVDACAQRSCIEKIGGGNDAFVVAPQSVAPAQEVDERKLDRLKFSSRSAFSVLVRKALRSSPPYVVKPPPPKISASSKRHARRNAPIRSCKPQVSTDQSIVPENLVEEGLGARTIMMGTGAAHVTERNHLAAKPLERRPNSALHPSHSGHRACTADFVPLRPPLLSNTTSRTLITKHPW